MASNPNPIPAPNDKAAIQVPLTATPVNTRDDMNRTRVMVGEFLKVDAPADGSFMAAGGKLVVGAGNKNNLGTPRPGFILCGLDATNTFLYLMPVPAGTPGATETKFVKGVLTLNLYPLYYKLGRLVPEDYREYYAVRLTPAEVTIGTVKGWAVYVNLNEFTKEKITRLSDEARAARTAKLRETLAKKKAAKQAAQESAPSVEPPTEEQE